MPRQIFAAEETDPKKQSEIVRRIHARSVGLSRLTDQMLNRALVIHRADTAMHEVIDLRKVAMTATEVFDDGNLFETGQMRLALPQSPVWVKGDALSLEEAAKNLISNATRHGKGAVKIVVSRDGDQARLAVRDEGPGMSADEARQFSQRFRAKDQHRTNGTGIGLSIARAVADAHGADLLVHTAPGKGFEIAIQMLATKSGDAQ
ncbi:HAMP domain-containing sensor histidine kinase [Devosia algicola]|uniref:histidine kinase n=1 Tax=Devosia algicola TaxID=3026418 RepID=A0ABY7YND7_9HYPH|nr:HAMP domain-containing sensor histidine kinase [Devosia algicola]WDR02697.1 HAMP domain-containing sensor histidine kinase [Devosia algicola]